MNFIFQPWQLLHLILAGWVNQQQQLAFDYLRSENQILREKLGKRRILLDDDQRRRLAVKGKVLGRKLLCQVGTLFTPDTILRWHRLLVARKWDYSDRRRKKPGRPVFSQEIRDLVVRIAKENPTWGYDRIQGALANVGHEISATSIANILKEHGIEPAPSRRRQSTWKTFLMHEAIRPAIVAHDLRGRIDAAGHGPTQRRRAGIVKGSVLAAAQQEAATQ